tara:strand:+ start:2729 stop:4087 length:1359 start_codon:yes stop_codon:yes gene_type:complete
MHFLYKLARLLGIDQAVFFTSFARIIQGLGGIVSIVFIAKYLTGIEQGFYFTFSSILAIKVFFELGLNGIITQYVAHEVASLSLEKDQYVGEIKHLSRMASLLHFCIKWYSILGVGLFLILSATGYVFFKNFYKTEVGVDWIIPWILLSFGTTIYFLISPFIAFIEGLGKVKEIAKIRLIEQIGTLIGLWSGLIFGLKLYVGGIGLFVGMLILCFFILKHFYTLLKNIYSINISEKVSYVKEILPYQWKIAVSWISGYFIFQLFNPVIFATEGAVIAGQMGMTIAAISAIQSLSLSWINTKVPLFSNLIALKKYIELDKIFNVTLKQSVFINGSALTILFLIITLIRKYNIIIDGIFVGDRFLDNLPMILMMIPIFLNQYVFSWATYLRCHKKEPLLVMSIVNAILCTLSIILMQKYYGIIGITFGYCTITFFTLIWTYSIFKNKKKKWHSI